LGDALRSFAPESSVGSSEVAGIESKDLISAQAREAFARSVIAADIRAEIELRGVVSTYFRTEVPHTFAASVAAFFMSIRTPKTGRGERPQYPESAGWTPGSDDRSSGLQSMHWDLRDPAGGEIKAHEVLDGAG
jgi:hypothetical protein